MTNIVLVTTTPQKDTARSIGIPTGAGTEYEHCPLQVGDLINWPEAPTVAYRVTRRLFRPATDQRPAQWFLSIELADEEPFPPE